MLTTSRGSLGSCRSLLLTTGLLPFLTSPAWSQTRERVDGEGDVARAAAGTAVLPGGVCVFGPATPGTSTIFNPTGTLASVNPALLQGFVCAIGPATRATVENSQFNVFTIDKSWRSFMAADVPGDSETVLQGQITGTVSVQGFLHLIGVGQANSEVLVEVIDTTDLDPNKHYVVNCKTLSKHEIISALKASVAADLNVEGGAAYLGGGFGVGIGSEIHFQLKKISDTVDFGLDVSLRRGHSYRVVVRNKIESRLTAAGTGLGLPTVGKAAAVFFPADRPQTLVPNLVMDEFTRLTAINGLLRIPTSPALLPDIDLVREGLITILTPDNREFFDVLVNRIDIDIPFTNIPFTTIQGLRTSEFGLPATQTMNNLADFFFNLGNRTAVTEEPINTPGVTVTRLLLSVEQDETELAERQRIEDSLERCRPNLDHIFPTVLMRPDGTKLTGGKLEKVFLVVKERIDQAPFANVPMGQIQKAQNNLNMAIMARDAGLYRQAHRFLCRAYDRLVGDDDHGDDGDDDHGEGS